MASAQEFDDRVAETQSGAKEVQDFALKTSYAFPSADVLVPAPMAVSILGQLTLVATATDFKLVRPAQGFKHVRYPDSFRATIMQLVNSGCLALNQSFVNFDEINKRCAAVRPGVNNIVQLLVGHEENNPRQNEQAIERHLPNQITALSKTVQACLEKAKETDSVFNLLLELTMEIHESCSATQGENEGRIREADIRMAILEKEQEAAVEMKRIGTETLQNARDDFTNAQNQFNSAIDDLPGPWTITGMELLDTLTSAANTLTLGFLKLGKRRAPAGPSGPVHATVQPEPSVDMSDVADPGYQKASTLRTYAEMLDSLLICGDNGRPDWSAIKSHQHGGCTSIRVGLEQVLKSIKPNHKYAGQPTNYAMQFARKGIELSHRLGLIVPPGSQNDLTRLAGEVAIWRDNVMAFASTADLKLGSSRVGSNAFLPEPNYSPTGSSAELAIRNAQYRLAVTQAQLHASRENSRAASDKLMEVNDQLGNILGQISSIDVQKQNWEEITGILLRAIDFLCELKRYLNNLVHFFDAVNNLVSVTLRESAEQFIQIVKDSAAIELDPGKEPRKLGTITLDAWARQAIYNQALSTAKISRVVENISDMYVTLYDGNVHPGVNMLLGMGKLVGANDPEAVAAAGKEIQDWAQEASERIVHLVGERMHASEQDIQKRMRELERSLGGIVPESSKIEQIVHRAEEDQVKEVAIEIETAVKENPVLKQQTKRNVFV